MPPFPPLFLSATASAATILVGDCSGSQVEKYSATGTNLVAFVTAGSGGFSVPGGFAFQPNGNAYVAGNSRFFILDGTTGAIISNVAAGVSHGLAFRPSNRHLLLTVEVVPLAGGAASTFASDFTNPEYLALLGSSLYLTDYSASRVDVINSSGAATGFFTTPFSPYGIAVQASALPEPATFAIVGEGLFALTAAPTRKIRSGS